MTGDNDFFCGNVRMNPAFFTDRYRTAAADFTGELPVDPQIGLAQHFAFKCLSRAQQRIGCRRPPALLRLIPHVNPSL
ncbi:hypothetical protein D3C71_2060040 [compost metagenome]